MTAKPRVFVGSSVEGLGIANAIQRNLEHNYYVNVWNQGIFKPSSTTLEDLIKALGTFDFAIFVFKPEDVVKMRNQTEMSIRDNVIFEMGLFIGRLGKERTFYIIPREEKFHLPTDLIGFNPATYDPGHPEIAAAIGGACTSIMEQMNSLSTLK
ncbi:nucleotide-binding protein [Peribacillus sp. FSL K6-1552]|uniref:nucleotide-binding protein n=1 Tax=Peribacillus sp. FSL K6-1552 TaxID=2954514 RepID=UPI0030FBD2A8